MSLNAVQIDPSAAFLSAQDDIENEKCKVQSEKP